MSIVGPHGAPKGASSRTGQFALMGTTVFGVSLVVLTRYAFRTPLGYPYFFDEGSTLYAAERIASGDHLYRDLLYFKAPLSYYSLGWLFRIFPITLETARLAGAVLLAGIVTGSGLLSARIARSEDKDPLFSWIVGITVAVVVLYVTAQRVTWHNSWCAAFASLVAMSLYIRTTENDNRIRLAVVGGVVGVTLLTKQTFGVALFAGIVAHLSILCGVERSSVSLRSLIPITVGLICPLALWALYMHEQGVLASFLQLAVIYPIGNNELISALALRPPPVGLTIECLVFYGPPILLMLLAADAVRRVQHGAAMISEQLAYAVLALFVYGALLPSVNYSHLRPILPVSLIVIAPWIVRATRPLSNHLRRLTATALLVGVVVAAVRAMPSWTIPQEPLGAARAGRVTADPRDARELQELVCAIDRRVGSSEAIFVVPWAPLVYFLSERRNPTRTRIIGPGQWNGEVYQREFVRDLEDEPVNLVIHVRELPGTQFDEPTLYATTLSDHLDTYFERVATVGRFDLLMREAR